jgi:hypothetical protein
MERSLNNGTYTTLYGCETWSLTLREQHRLRVFENRVLGPISGANREEATGDWRQQHIVELHDLYSSVDIVAVTKEEEMGGACGTYGGDDKCIQNIGAET